VKPYPGLRTFERGDRHYFFGRERESYALYRLLDRNSFVTVVGNSGSGKSSLVRAGLLPLLEDESENDGGRVWRCATLRPGESPISRLAEALSGLDDEDWDESVEREVRRVRIEFALRRSSLGFAKALEDVPDAGTDPILLVIDQFEEIFRYGGFGEDSVSDALWRDETANFVQLLLEATRGYGDAVRVLITMRSDFIGDCARFQGLPEAVSAAPFLVPALTRAQREAVIVEPLAKVGAEIEPALVERLLNDIGNQHDQLPVLQHCLARLWERAKAEERSDGPRITTEHYRAIGGIAGALTQHADAVLASLDGMDMTVEQIFRALSQRDDEGRAVRRALPFSQLVAETGMPAENVRTVLDRFRAEDCGFIVPAPASVPLLRDDDRVDVVHEALLRGWQRISDEPDGWLAAEESDGRRYRAMLSFLET